MWQDILARLLAGLDDPYQVIGAAVAFAVCGFALLFGGRAEKLAGAVLLVGQFATTYGQDLSRWIGPDYGILTIDLVVLAVLFGLALRTDRTWALFAASFHLLAVLTHVAAGLDSQVRTHAYAVVLNLLGYLVYLALALGTAEALSRRRRERGALSEVE